MLVCDSYMGRDIDIVIISFAMNTIIRHIVIVYYHISGIHRFLFVMNDPQPF